VLTFPIVCKSFRCLDILDLTGLAAPQQEHCPLQDDVVHPITWTEVNAHFYDAVTNSLGIARVARLLKSIDASKDFGASLQILKTLDPIDEGFRLDDICHGHLCRI
jgi:hypothetical protein